MATSTGHRHPDRGADEPVRITTAAHSPAEELAHRQRRYVISMVIRTVCFVAAVAVGPGWLRWLLIAAALLLPYVAVVMANAGDTRDDAFELRDDGYRSELPPADGPSADDPEEPR